jgi:hypothetical protein
MTLTEAQRLAFLKGREKRMANIEKKKMEKAELEAMSGEPLQDEPAPEKPKLVRKPRKTKIPVDVKIDMDMVKKEETAPVPDPDPEPMKEEEPFKEPSVSANLPTFYDEDSIANKVVDMLLKKGVGIHPPQAVEQVKIKPKKPRVVKPKTAEFQSPAPSLPATSTFSWL